MFRMEVILNVLLGLSLAAVLGVLVTGVVVFARGGAVNERLGHRLMNLRVATQFVAILLLALLVLVHHLAPQ